MDGWLDGWVRGWGGLVGSCPHGFNHFIAKNCGSGFCLLEVDDLFAAFGDLARVELALGNKSNMKKKKKKPTGAACTGRTCDPTYSNPSAQRCA